MADPSGHRIAVVYVDDFGVSYRVTADKAAALQPTTGAVAALGTEPVLPVGIRMRHAPFHSSGLTPNVTREVVIYTQAAVAALTPASTVSLEVGDNPTTLTWSQKYTGEINKRRRVTNQLT